MVGLEPTASMLETMETLKISISILNNTLGVLKP